MVGGGAQGILREGASGSLAGFGRSVDCGPVNREWINRPAV